MECRDAHVLISLSIDGEAAEGDRARLEGHLVACADCRALADRWRRNDGVVREGLRAPQPPADLADRILSRVEEPPRAPRIRWGRWAVHLAAAAVAVFCITDVYIRHQISDAEGSPEQDFLLISSAEAASGGRTMTTVQLVSTRERIGIAGAKVTLSWRRPGDTRETRLAEGTTQEDGTCPLALPIPPEAEGDYEVVARVLGPKGEEEVKRRLTVRREFKLFVSTDKPMYQPSQTIHIRAMALSAADLAPAQGLPLLVEVFDSKQNKVFKRSFKTSTFGIVSTDFELADEVLQGVYKVKATAGNTSSEAQVEVKRYVLPKFRVKVETEKSWYLPGEKVKGTVRADYFFGKAVEGGKVKLVCSTWAAEEVALGTWDGKTDASGTARFEVLLPDRLHGIDLLQGDAPLLLRVGVTDSADHSQEVNASLTVAQSPIRIVLVPESGRLVPDVENIVYVLTTYPDGRPAQCEVTLNPSFTVLTNSQPGQGMTTVTTDETGLAQVRLMPYSGQGMFGTVHAKDAAGNERMLMVDEVAQSLGSLEQNGGFLLRPDKAIYKAGETMKLALVAPSVRGSFFVDLVREGRTLHTATVEVKDAAGALEIDLPPEAFGAIQVHAYKIAASGHFVRDTRVVLVDPPAGLSMSASLDKESYRPGQAARIELRVTNQAGAGVPSAVGLSIVDESLFALAETKPGLERVYAAIEEDILKPRYQIKSCPYTPATFAMPDARPQAPEPRIQALATVSLAAAGVDLLEQAVERSAPMRAAQLDRDRGVLRRRLRDVEGFGASAFAVAAGLALLVLIGGAIAKAGTGTGSSCLASSLVTILLVAILSALLLPALSSARKSSRSFDEGSVRNPVTLSTAQASDMDDHQGQQHAHTLKSFHTEGDMSPAAVSHPRRTEPPRLRQWFPETLWWAPEVVTDETGRASVTVPNVADSITTWRIVASAVSARGEMGGMTGGLRVFQDFFVDPDLPVALTQGDQVDLPVAVYNWLTEPQEVELTLAPSEGFTLLDHEPKKSIRMEASSVGVVRFPIRVERIGGWSVRVDARGSKGLADAIQRVVQVLPDGKEVPYGASDRLSPSSKQTVTIPKEAIDGASVLLVKLLPGSFAEVKDGMEGMLRLPHG